MKKQLLLLIAFAVGVLGSKAQTDVTSDWIKNADFSGEFQVEKYPTSSHDRAIYKPAEWSMDYNNISQWNMTAINTSSLATNNFTGVYALSDTDNKYMVRFRDNQTSEYIDLYQTVSVPSDGLYVFAADLIRQNGSKIDVALYVGDQTVSNSSTGAWEKKFLSKSLTSGENIRVGIKFTNKGADGVIAGADNVNVYKMPFEAGDYYLKNVGSGMYLDGGNDWGTYASLSTIGIETKLDYAVNGYTISTAKNYNNKYLGSNGYVDNGTAAVWNFADNGDGTYTLTNGGNTLYWSGTGDKLTLDANAPNSNNSKWQLVTKNDRLAPVANATSSNPVDVSFLIKNPGFGRNVIKGWNGDFDIGVNDDNQANSKYYVGEKYNGNFDANQTLENLTNGVYEISAQGFYRNGSTNDKNAYLYGNSTQIALKNIFEDAKTTSGNGFNNEVVSGSGIYTPNNRVDVCLTFLDNNYNNSVKVTVSDGKLKIGIKESVNATNDWTVFDNFRLSYRGTDELITMLQSTISTAEGMVSSPMQSGVKTALQNAIDEANGALSGDVPTILAKQEALDTAIDNARTSITLYEAVNVARGVVKGQETDASLENTIDDKYNGGTYNAVSEVYDDFYAYEASKLGSAANTDYTPAIVNNSFERGDTQGWTYEKSKDDGAKTNTNPYTTTGIDGSYLFNIWDKGNQITQTIKSLPEGYYKLEALVTNGARVFLIANNNQVGVDCANSGEFYPASITIKVTDGSLTIGAEGCKNDASRSFGGEWWYKADNFRLTYLGETAEMTDAEIAAIKTRVEAMTDPMNADVRSSMNEALVALQTEKTPEAYNTLENAIETAKASVEAYKSAKTKLEAMALFLETTNLYTESARVTYYQQWKDKYDNFTLTDAEANALENPNTITGHRAANMVDDLLTSVWDTTSENWNSYHVNTWSNEGESDGSGFKVPFFEYWTSDNSSLGAKTLTATIEGLEPAAYKVSAKVRVRQRNRTDEEKTNDEGLKVSESIKLQANSGTEVDVTVGTQVGETQFYLGEFEAVCSVGTDGKLIVKFVVSENSNISWLSFRDVKFTINEELANAEEIAALTTAVNNAKAKTIGFLEDEYAPYNNVTGITTLAEADNVLANYTTKANINNATTALNGVTWIQNAEEVNAIFDPTFEYDYSGQTDTNIQPLGWYRVLGNRSDGYNVRFMSSKNAENNKIPENATSSGNAMMTKVHAYYGGETGYSLPLKANTFYYLKFRYGVYGSRSDQCDNLNVHINLYKEDGTEINTSHINPKYFSALERGGDTNDSKWYDYIGWFKTDEACNYTLGLMKNDGTTQNQFVFSDFELYRGATATMKVNAGKYGTFMAPFEITLPADVSAYSVDKVENGVINLKELSGNIPAMTPLVLENKGTEDINDKLYEKCVVNDNTNTQGLLTGYLLAAEVPAMKSDDTHSRYVLQTQNDKQAFYIISKTTDYQLKTNNRAYLTVPVDANNNEVKMLNFDYGDDVVTGISSVEMLISGNVEIFNAAGVKVSSLQKGINIIRTADGKTQKVLVK